MCSYRPSSGPVAVQPLQQVLGLRSDMAGWEPWRPLNAGLVPYVEPIPGVYALALVSQPADGIRIAYYGESRNIQSRLLQHARNAAATDKFSSGFWEERGGDHNLNIYHALRSIGQPLWFFSWCPCQEHFDAESDLVYWHRRLNPFGSILLNKSKVGGYEEIGALVQALILDIQDMCYSRPNHLQEISDWWAADWGNLAPQVLPIPKNNRI